MTVIRLLTPLLLIAGGTTLLGVAASGRPGLITRLQIVDGLQELRRRERRRAISSLLAVLALVSIPVELWVVRPEMWSGLALAAPAAVVVLPIVLAFVVEVVVAVGGGGPAPRLPLALPWQRRVARTLALAAATPLVTPTPGRERVREQIQLDANGQGPDGLPIAGDTPPAPSDPPTSPTGSTPRTPPGT